MPEEDVPIPTQWNASCMCGNDCDSLANLKNTFKFVLKNNDFHFWANLSPNNVFFNPPLREFWWSHVVVVLQEPLSPRTRTQILQWLRGCDTRPPKNESVGHNGNTPHLFGTPPTDPICPCTPDHRRPVIPRPGECPAVLDRIFWNAQKREKSWNLSSLPRIMFSSLSFLWPIVE